METGSAQARPLADRTDRLSLLLHPGVLAMSPERRSLAHPLSRHGLLRRLLLLASAALPGLVLAQKWPAQPVRIIVPYTAGGGSDNIARALGTELSRELGHPVGVDHKPGAAAMLGAELVARAAPDGYTLLMADMPHTITPSLYKTPYDALKDFTPVALIGSSPLVLAVNPKFRAQNVKEYIALARARPGQINFASGGTGTATHLAGELFKQQTDTFITHIPYKGSGQAIADVVAGHTESMFASAPTVVPHIRSGALRALATTGAQRSPALPQVPTLGESGVRGLTVLHWFGLLAPARLPAGVQATLNDAVSRALATPALQARLQSLGLDLTPRTPAEFGAQMETDAARWARVVKERNIKAD
jgi:tripartite-type tricarboxylate transporter receptor subunit TctC